MPLNPAYIPALSTVIIERLKALAIEAGIANLAEGVPDGIESLEPITNDGLQLVEARQLRLGERRNLLPRLRVLSYIHVVDLHVRLTAAPVLARRGVFPCAYCAPTRLLSMYCSRSSGRTRRRARLPFPGSATDGRR